MPRVDAQQVRRRAARLDVVQRYAERKAAAPLAAQLEAWHQRAAQLAAIANHRLLHGRPTDAVREEASTLVDAVVRAVEEWRASLGETAMTGELLDTERSSRTIIATLDTLLQRLRVN